MRKKYSAVEKINILKKHLDDGVSVSELSKKFEIHPNQFYRWKKELFEGALETFSGKHSGGSKRKKSRKDRVEQELQKKDRIISQLAEENLELKKKYFGEV